MDRPLCTFRGCNCQVKNYTKPNILLLGPTGSGKTYLLRNLAAACLHLVMNV